MAGVYERLPAEPAPPARRLAAMPAARLLLVGLLALALSACTMLGGFGAPGTGPLVTVSTRGGMCVNGPCGDTVVLDHDGTVHAAAKPPNELGHVPAQALATLKAAIAATDFAAIKSHPFTGECPVNFDGQELIFEFAVAGTTQRIASCEVEIDWGHPLFVATGVALGEWIAMPLT
jgi:hypothetical protein